MFSSITSGILLFSGGFIILSLSLLGSVRAVIQVTPHEEPETLKVTR